jgi:hypothetical protein
MGLFTARASVDPDFSTAGTDRKRKLAFRADEIKSRAAAFDREREYAEVALFFAEQARAAALAKIEEFERDGKRGRAMAATLELADAEERVDHTRSRIKLIDSERARWSKVRPEVEADWV